MAISEDEFFAMFLGVSIKCRGKYIICGVLNLIIRRDVTFRLSSGWKYLQSDRYNLHWSTIKVVPTLLGSIWPLLYIYIASTKFRWINFTLRWTKVIKTAWSSIRQNFDTSFMVFQWGVALGRGCVPLCNEFSFITVRWLNLI